MLEMFLPVMIGAAATTGVAAAVLLGLVRVLGGREAVRGGLGGAAAALALGVGFAVSTRIAQGEWAGIPAASASKWALWIGAGVFVAAGVLSAARVIRPGSGWWVGTVIGAAVLGIGAQGATVHLPLKTVLPAQVADAGAQAWWRIGTLLAMVAACVVVALACRGSGRGEGDEPRRWWERLRDEHWGTFALGLAFAVSTPAIVFSSYLSYAQMMLGVGIGWGVLAVVSLVWRVPLSAAGAAVAGVYGMLWLVTYFLASSRVGTLALAGLAPVAIGVGLLPPLARGGKGGWVRFVVVSVLVAGLAGAGAAVVGAEYFAQEAGE